MSDVPPANREDAESVVFEWNRELAVSELPNEL